jgi:hypothetical protein
MIPMRMASKPSSHGPTDQRYATLSGRRCCVATLSGSVNPRGQATSYFFEYGNTTAYRAETGALSAGSGSTSVAVSAPIAPLTPNTTYHYRLVASNAAGTTTGHDVSFTTARPPAAVTIHASAGTVTFGEFTSSRRRAAGTRSRAPGCAASLARFSFYSVSVPVRSSGRYRVLVPADRGHGAAAAGSFASKCAKRGWHGVEAPAAHLP